MTLLTTYALGRLAFGGMVLVAPGAGGRLLAGDGGATPDAQAFLRGMGGRELGLALGLLRAIGDAGAVRRWLLAGVLADAGDLAGLTGSWRELTPGKREPGAVFAAVATAAGLALLVTERNR